MFSQHVSASDVSELASPSYQPLNYTPTQQMQHLHDVMEANPWLQSLDTLSEVQLPKPFTHINRHFLMATIFSATCGALSVIVYADGSESYGKLAMVGGVSVNLTQNLMFGYNVYDSIIDNISHKRYSRLLATSIAGTLTSLPLTVAEFIEFCKDYSEFKRYFSTAATFVGNLPLNMYGMQIAWDELCNFIYDVPELRQFLNNKLKEAVQDDPALSTSLQKEYSRWVDLCGKAGGLGFGVFLASAQTCYVSLISRVLFEKVWADLAFAIALGVFADSPTIILAIFKSGTELGLEMAHKAADIANYVYEKCAHSVDTGLFSASSRKLKYFATSFLINAPLSFLAFHSNGPARNAYYNNMPEEYQYKVTDVSVVWGTIAYNLIMSFISVHGAVKKAEVAYTPINTIEYEQHKVRAYQQFILNAPASKVKDFIAQEGTFTSEEKNQVLSYKSNYQKFKDFFVCRSNRTVSGSEPEPAQTMQNRV